VAKRRAFRFGSGSNCLKRDASRDFRPVARDVL